MPLRSRWRLLGLGRTLTVKFMARAGADGPAPIKPAHPRVSFQSESIQWSRRRSVIAKTFGSRSVVGEQRTAFLGDQQVEGKTAGVPPANGPELLLGPLDRHLQQLGGGERRPLRPLVELRAQAAEGAPVLGHDLALTRTLAQRPSTGPWGSGAGN